MQLRDINFYLMKKGKVKFCRSCADSCIKREMKLIEGAEMSTMKELTQLTAESDKVITF